MPHLTPSSINAPQGRSLRASVLAMLGLFFVVMMVALDQTVVVTALPTIVAELHGFELYAWVGTAYLLTSVVTVPVFGRLGDYYGRKFFIIASVSIFTVASLLCGLASSMLLLVVSRGLQGIGGGMLVGTAVACVSDLFPDVKARIRWRVMLSSGLGIANAFGPSLGGLLTKYLGWRSVFYVNLPVGLLSLVFLWRFLPHIRHTKTDRKIKLDWPGALLIAAALGSLQMLVEWLPDHHLSAAIWGLGLFSLAAFIGLWTWEKHATNPVFPLEMLNDRVLNPIFVLSLLSGLITFVLLFYTPLLLQGGLGLSPDAAGLLVTPLVIFITIGSITNGRIITRIPKPAIMMYIGFALFGMAIAGLMMVGKGTPQWLIIISLIGAGLGQGFVNPNSTIFAQELADQTQLGIVTATIQTLRMVGGMVGTALVGTIVNHIYVQNVQHSLVSSQAIRWLPQLDHPQILLDKAKELAFVTQLSALGINGHSLIEAGRQSLISAIHTGVFFLIIAVLIAVWQLRRLPFISFRGDTAAPDKNHQANVASSMAE